MVYMCASRGLVLVIGQLWMSLQMLAQETWALAKLRGREQEGIRLEQQHEEAILGWTLLAPLDGIVRASSFWRSGGARGGMRRS